MATSGSGPPVVKSANWLSHLEFDWQSPVWRHWFRFLSNGRQLIRFDPRGCGLSDWDAQDLSHAVQCLYNLGRVKEFDELVESTIGVHKENWRVLWTAAQQYMSTQHQGFLIAGEYERGPHRGGGEVKNSVERDRVRALQLMQQAMPLAAKDDNKDEVSTYYLRFGEMLLNNRGYYEAWRLQYLSDLAKLPDLDDGYFYYRDYNGAPVDAEGNPVYHTLPPSWEAAETDGQRWRWVLSMAIENSSRQRIEGSCDRARAIVSRCCCPPESFVPSSCSRSFTSSQTAACRRQRSTRPSISVRPRTPAILGANATLSKMLIGSPTGRGATIPTFRRS